MPQVDNVKSVPRQPFFKPLGVVVLAVAVLAGVAALGYVAWYYFGPPSANEVAGQVNTLDVQGKYAQAEQKLTKAYKRAWRKMDKETLLAEWGATEADQNNNSAALDYYEQLNTMDPNNRSTLESIAYTADLLGNKVVALKAYQQELPLLEAASPQGPTTASDISGIKQRITELQQ